MKTVQFLIRLETSSVVAENKFRGDLQSLLDKHDAEICQLDWLRKMDKYFEKSDKEQILVKE